MVVSHRHFYSGIPVRQSTHCAVPAVPGIGPTSYEGGTIRTHVVPPKGAVLGEVLSYPYAKVKVRFEQSHNIDI